MRLGPILLLGLPSILLPLLAAAAGDGASRQDLSPTDRDKVARVLAPPADWTVPEPFERMTGGAATDRSAVGPDSLTPLAPNLDGPTEFDALIGRAVFQKLWVAAPTSTLASDGLGPFHDARACSDCHIRDGRGDAPGSADAIGPVLRLAHPAGGDPIYGAQLQARAVTGIAREGRYDVTWRESIVTLSDGTAVPLRRPEVIARDLATGPIDPATTPSLRVAPPVIGLGLLAAVDEGDLLARADPEDRDGDGISGRANRAPDAAGRPGPVGRFGWKATAASLEEQAARAFSVDLGLSTARFPDAAGDCTTRQPLCADLPDGVQPSQGPYEVPDDLLRLTTLYTASLAVPVRRGADDPAVLAGKRLFHDIGCAACHVPKYVTRRDATPAAMAFQLIWPYTDLLLHDMGEDLADGAAEGLATGREWRTPPLWGLGLAHDVNPRAGLLHDGRARSVLEAVLWHGGEAQRARDRVVGLAAADRAALIAFLESL